MRTRHIAVVTLAATMALSSTADAMPTFTSAARATRNGCYDSTTVLDAYGARHGFVRCNVPKGTTPLYYATAAAGTSKWSLKQVAANASKLLDATDDGTASYALYVTQNGTHILKRSRSGATTRWHVSTRQPDTGSIIARDGKWWADWAALVPNDSGACLCYYLFQSKTIGKAQQAKRVGEGQEPRLAFGADEQPIMVYRNPDWDIGGDILLSHHTASGWSKPHKLNGAHGGERPDIERLGNVTRVSWLHNTTGHYFDVVLATRFDGGTWHKKEFHRVYGWDNFIRARPALISYSGGHLFLAWTAISHSRGVGYVAERSGGSWSTHLLSDGTSGDGIVAGLGSVNGRAYLVLEHSNAVNSYVVTRHQ